MALLNTLIENFETAMNNLRKTQIHFLYFTCTDDTLIPKVKSEFAAFDHDRHPYYITQGEQRGWYHIYQESVLRYLVNVHGNSIASFVTAEDEQRPSSLEANQGDHLTIGVKRLRTGIALKTHITMYTEETPFKFDRSSTECDMDLFIANNPVEITDATVCFSKTRTKDITLIEQYGKVPYGIKLVKLISKVFQGNHSLQGGSCIRMKDKKHKLHTGSRGGMYIMRGGRKSYLRNKQKGGSISYNTITFGDELISFIMDFVVSPLYRVHSNLSEVTILYDENNTLGTRSNENIVLLYDFKDKSRSIFYINAYKAMMALYAYTFEKSLPPLQPNAATTSDASMPSITQEERKCLDEFMQIGRTIAVHGGKFEETVTSTQMSKKN